MGHIANVCRAFIGVEGFRSGRASLTAFSLAAAGCEPATVNLRGTGMVSVPGAELRYDVVGAGDPIVILHGGPGIGYHYLREDLTRLLASSYTLVFYDQRGSGQSTGSADTAAITIATFVDDLDRVRSATGLERLTLLAHSFGGLLGMHYAITHPGRVDKLVLLDPDPATYEQWAEFQDIIAPKRTAEDEWELTSIRSQPDWNTDPTLVERAFKVSLRAYFAEPALADSLDLGFDDRVIHNYATTYNAMRQHLGRYDILDRLMAISAPTLVLYGGSGIFPRRAADSLVARIPDARLVVVEGAGHFIHLEAPDRFVTELGEFFRP